MTVTVYTANIGWRDDIRPAVEQSVPGVQYLYYCDDGPDAPAPWTTIRVTRQLDVHPNMQAKWYRTHPPLVADDDRAIWIDANMEITSHYMVEDALAALGDAPVAAWKHPRRDDIYEEIEASLGAEAQGGRYDHLPLRAQADAYRAEGYPEHNGLYATGTLVWTTKALPFAQAWYDECVRWGYQDQVSFPVVAWRMGIDIATFPIVQTRGRYNRRQGWWGNAWMKLWNHREGTGGP